jgi:hypothetical protein
MSGALRREHIPGEKRQGGGQAPVRGQGPAELGGIVVGALDRIDGSECGDRDLARRHPGDQRHTSICQFEGPTFVSVSTMWQ